MVVGPFVVSEACVVLLPTLVDVVGVDVVDGAVGSTITSGAVVDESSPPQAATASAAATDATTVRVFSEAAGLITPFPGSMSLPLRGSFFQIVCGFEHTRQTSPSGSMFEVSEVLLAPRPFTGQNGGTDLHAMDDLTGVEVLRPRHVAAQLRGGYARSLHPRTRDGCLRRSRKLR